MSIEDWKIARLDDIKANKKWAINGGPFGSNLVRRDYNQQGVPVIRGANLSGESRFNTNEFVFVTEDKADALLANNAHPGDIIFTQRGTLGQVGFIPKDSPYKRFVISQSQMKLTVDETMAYPEYVYYYFSSPIAISRIKNLAFSSGVPHINLDILRNFEIELPPPPTQRKIAAILSAYDDLIENNTRRIQILEEIAQAIYREWFVHFRFPGHENVSIVDSDTELGEVPEGWEVISISEIASIYRGKSYRSYELLEEGGLPFLNLKCVDRDGGFRQDGIKRFQGDFKETQSAKPGDIIIALTDMTQERRIIARAARVPDTGENFFVMSMDLVKVISSLELSQSYLYTMLRYSSFPDEVKEFANGVNVLHLSPKFIEDYRFPLPPKSLSGEFGGIADSIYLQIDNLHRENANLRSTRDLLLPRLVSGQVDVSELEIKV